MRPEIPEGKGGDRLDFISPDVQLRELAEGKITRVLASEDLPSDIKEKVGGDVVVKQYTLRKLSHDHPDYPIELWESRVFGARSIEDAKGMSLVDRAKVLKDRQHRMVEFFDDLPNSVVPSQFLVAKDRDNKPAIFEIQRKVEGFQTWRNTEGLEDIVKKLSPEARRNFYKQASIFIQKLRMLYDKASKNELEHGINDIASYGNMGIDEQGSIKIVDTNREYIHGVIEIEGIPFTDRGVMRNTELLIKEIESILASEHVPENP